MKAFGSGRVERLKQLSPSVLLTIGLVYLLGVWAVDCSTPMGVSFTVFYTFGVIFVGWGAGRWPATAAASVAAALLLSVECLVVHRPLGWVIVWNVVTRFLMFSVVGWMTAEATRLTRRLNAAVAERTAELSAETQRHKATAARLTQDVADRARTEESLRQSEETLRVFLNAIPEVAVLADARGDILFANAGFARSLRLTPREVQGRPLFGLLPAEVATQPPWSGRTAYFKQVVETAQPVQFEDSRADRHFISWAAPVTAPDGQVSRVAILAFDITQRVRTQEQLQLQARVLESMAEAVLMADESGTITLTNRAADVMLGYERGELLGKSLFVLSHHALPEFQSVFQTAFEHGRAGASDTGEYDARRRDGSLIRVETRTTGLTVGGRQFLVVVGQDVTERRQAEAALRESEALLRTFYDSPAALRGIVELTDRDIRVLSANASQAARYDRTSETIQGALASDLGISAATIEAWRAKFLESQRLNQPVTFEYATDFRAAGSWAMATVSLLNQGPDGQPRFGYVAYDITERKRAELAREALLALGTCLNSASTPLEAGRAIFASADQLWKWDAATLDMYYPETDRMEPVLFFDVIDGRRQEVPPVHLGGTPTPRMSRIMRQGPELIRRDSADLPIPDCVRFGDVSRVSAAVMCVPIRREGQPVGVLSIQSYTPRAYSEADLSTLQALADHCGGALQRIRAEAALRASEERYRSLVNNLNVGVYRNTLEDGGRFVQVNPALAHIHGYDSVEDFQRVRVADLYQEPRDRDAFLAELLRQGSVLGYEARLKRRDGTTIFGAIKAAVHRAPDGKVQWIDGVLEDVTEQRKARQELSDALELNRKLIAASTVGIAAYKADGQCILVNEALARVTGGSIPQLLAQNLWHIEALREIGFLQKARETLRSHQPSEAEFRFRTSFGRELSAHVRLTSFTSQGELHLLLLLADVSERKRAEQALRQSEAALRVFLDAVPEPAFLMDPHGTLLLVNQAMAQSLGQSPEQLVGRDAFGLIPPDVARTRRRFIDQVLTAREAVRFEDSRGGRDFINCVTPVLGSTGAVSQVAVFAFDISDRKRSEARQQAQRDLAIELGVTTDLRTALTRLTDVALRTVDELDCGGAYLLDPRSGDLELVTHCGLSEGFIQAVTHYPAAAPQTALVRTGRPLYALPSEVPPASRPLLDTEGLKFLAVLPLSHEGQVLGALNLGSHRHREVPRPSQVVLEAIAAQAAGAIARIQAEDALRQSEARLRAIITSAPVLLFAVDAHGLLAFEDGQALKALGVLPGSRTGRPVEDVFAQSPAILENVRRALRGEEFNSRIELAGTALDFWYSPARDKSGNLTGCIGVATNVTDRHRLERQILEISDREQARLGQDLHDGLCQQLVSLAFDANSLERDLSAHHRPEARRAGRIVVALDESITVARQLARGLFPVSLVSEGLTPALEELANATQERFPVRCRFERHGPIPPPSEPVAIHLYRIAREAVNNAIKHGRPSLVVIRLAARAGQLELTITDDGAGMGSRGTPAAGMGLQIMDYRARAIGATLRIGPGPRGGTAVSCCLSPHAR
jgi:PAS domain S-box-containing protein